MRLEVAGDDPQLIDLVGRNVRTEITVASGACDRRRRTMDELLRIVRKLSEIDEPAPGQPERIEPRRGRMRGQDEA